MLVLSTRSAPTVRVFLFDALCEEMEEYSSSGQNHARGQSERKWISTPQTGILFRTLRRNDLCDWLSSEACA